MATMSGLQWRQTAVSYLDLHKRSESVYVAHNLWVVVEGEDQLATVRPQFVARELRGQAPQVLLKNRRQTQYCPGPVRTQF